MPRPQRRDQRLGLPRPGGLRRSALAEGRTLAGVKGARITVRCDCGEVNYVEYGQTWQCPKCRRRWNTSQIPAEEYWGLMREMRQERFKIMGASLAVAGTFLALTFLVSTAFFLLIPMTFGAWYLVYMPRWRKRLRLKARAAPTWKLRPE
jgi:hypothetical protein